MYLLLDMTNKATLYGMNDPITKEIALSKDVVFDKWLVGYTMSSTNKNMMKAPFHLDYQYEKTKSLKPNKRTSWKNFNMKFSNPHALLNQPILCAIHHHNWTREVLEDHFL